MLRVLVVPSSVSVRWGGGGLGRSARALGRHPARLVPLHSSGSSRGQDPSHGFPPFPGVVTVLVSGFGVDRWAVGSEIPADRGLNCMTYR